MAIAEKAVNTLRLPELRAEYFPASGPFPWLDRPDALYEITARRERGEISETEAELCRRWCADGYVVVENLIDREVLDSVWESYELAVRRGRIELPPEPAAPEDPYPGRCLNPHRKAGGFCRILKDRELLGTLSLLLGREAKPLQTIASHKGSQQGIHSDSIHMTTYPLGYLAAAWIAFEDIGPDCGPLVYYPGSHRLPYVFSRDVGIAPDDLKRIGYQSYHARYEPYVRALVAEHGLEPHYFHARKGDVLIWHANLIHGGSARRDLSLSRRSLVCHYYGRGAFVYHDLAASRSKQQYLGTCLLRDNTGKVRLLG